MIRVGDSSGGSSCPDTLDLSPAEIGELFLATVIQITDPVLVQAEQVENGEVEIAHVLAFTNSVVCPATIPEALCLASATGYVLP